MTHDSGIQRVCRRALRCATVALAAMLVVACGRAQPTGAAPLARAPIPAPDGRYGVGSILLDVEDTRPAAELPDGLVQMIEAQVWYPARRGNTGPFMPYFPRRIVLERMRAQGYFAQPSERIAGWARLDVHATRNALPAVRAGDFPLVLFAPAAGIPMEQYAALLQELASRGFVVVAVPPRAPRASSFRRTAADVRAEDPDQRAADLSLVLRRFVSATGSVGAIAQRADLTRAGAFGHVAGGLVALRACTREAVLQRCASLDGAPAQADLGRPLARPFLVIASRPDSAAAQATVTAGQVDAPARWLDLFTAHDGAAGALYALDGASTMTFTDAPFVMPAITGALGQRGDPVALQRLTVDALAAFFGVRDGPPLDPVDALDVARPELERVR